MAISIEGKRYASQAIYMDEMKGTENAISQSTLSSRLRSHSPQWKDWFTVGSIKDGTATKGFQLRMSADKYELFSLALAVNDLDRTKWLEAAARGLILNTIHILRDYDTDRPDIDVENLERAFNEVWKITPGSVLKKHLNEVA